MPVFRYQDPFPLGNDETEYRLLTKDHVSVADFAGQAILKVDPEGLTRLAHQALRDVSFLLRPAHNEQVAGILADPEASPNDRGASLVMIAKGNRSRQVTEACKKHGGFDVVDFPAFVLVDDKGNDFFEQPRC